MEKIKNYNIYESMHNDQYATMEHVITDNFKYRVSQLISEYADVMEALS